MRIVCDSCYIRNSGTCGASKTTGRAEIRMSHEYIDIPGVGTHELPPLLVHGIPDDASREEVVERATVLVEIEDMVADAPEQDMAHRRFDLALHLTDQYFGLLSHWAWGDSILE